MIQFNYSRTDVARNWEARWRAKRRKSFLCILQPFLNRLSLAGDYAERARHTNADAVTGWHSVVCIFKKVSEISFIVIIRQLMLCGTLRRRGAEIVSPNTLTIPQPPRLWNHVRYSEVTGRGNRFSQYSNHSWTPTVFESAAPSFPPR
jgi:hypothetical protein